MEAPESTLTTKGQEQQGSGQLTPTDPSIPAWANDGASGSQVPKNCPKTVKMITVSDSITSWTPLSLNDPKPPRRCCQKVLRSLCVKASITSFSLVNYNLHHQFSHWSRLGSASLWIALLPGMSCSVVQNLVYTKYHKCAFDWVHINMVWYMKVK